jgi:hypothetical protein
MRKTLGFLVAVSIMGGLSSSLAQVADETPQTMLAARYACKGLLVTSH